jgi:hypothetical protein
LVITGEHSGVWVAVLVAVDVSVSDTAGAASVTVTAESGVAESVALAMPATPGRSNTTPDRTNVPPMCKLFDIDICLFLPQDP